MIRNIFLMLVWLCCFSVAGRAQNIPTMENNHLSIRNGKVTIEYFSQGEGPTTLLLLHGWCINATYWMPQIEHFSPNYRVVAMNLPGFGWSSAEREEWTIEEYAADLTAFMEVLNLENVVLVGHSMSSEIVVETAIQNNPRIVGVVCVDNFKFVDVAWPEEEVKQMWEFFGKLEANYAELATGYAAGSLFTPNTPIEVKNNVLQNIADADPHISATSLIHLMKYSETEAAKLEQLPHTFYLINSDMPPTDEIGLKNRCKNGYHLETVMGTGHYPMAEKPEEFNAKLESVLGKMGR